MSNNRAARRRHQRAMSTANLTQTYVTNARVVPGWIHREDKTHPLFTTSIVSAFMYDAQSNQGAIAAYIAIQSGPRITEARNKVIDAFLNDPMLRGLDGKPNPWLFMVDDDMTFSEDAIHCLVARAENELGVDGQPIKVLGGLAFGGNRIAMYPTLYDLGRDEAQRLTLKPVEDYPRNALVRVGATGAACLLVHRDVLLAMWLQHRDHPHPWFVEATSGDAQFGEDIAFCVRAQAAGFAVHVDTSVKFGHMKQLKLDEALWEGKHDIVRGKIDDAVERNGVLEEVRGMTLPALIGDVRSHLEGDYRPRLEVLDQPMDLNDDAITLSYNGVLTPGAVLSVGTEDLYVLDWDQGSRSAIVIRGHRGTVVALHDDGDTVEVNPRFSSGQIYRGLRDEVRGWSQQLYRVAGGSMEVGANAAVAEVPATFAGLFGIVEAVSASHYRGGTSTELAVTSGVLYREIPIMGIIRNTASLGFTRELIRFGAVSNAGGSIHLTAGLPFGDLVRDDTTTLLSQGIQTYMEEPLTLGAAARLLRPREAARTQRHGQGEPRRGEEVPPMHTRNAGADLGLLAKEAFGRAARRLASSYPLRFT